MTHEIRDPPLDQGTGQIGTGHERVQGPEVQVHWTSRAGIGSAVGRDAGRDTLFHREKPGEFGPGTVIRGGTGEAKSGARGGKRLAGGSGHFVSKGKLTHQVVDPPSRHASTRT